MPWHTIAVNLLSVTKIISGGQTGADRAGLDFAIKHSIPHGGWCPKYRKAEDGTVPMKYQLQEADKPGYPYRTRLNVRDSDGTVIFTTTPPGPGSALTIRCCEELHKPRLVITLDSPVQATVNHFIAWIKEHNIKTLNVAGSRGSAFRDLALMVLNYVRIQSEQGGESPKKFLREVKVGIGLPKSEHGAQFINFEDANKMQCKVQCHGGEQVWIIGDLNRIALTPGQAKRLANTLERWAVAGNLGGE